MNAPETPLPSRCHGDSAAEQIDAMRSLFGAPRLRLEPVLGGPEADRVVTNPKIAIVDDEPINVKVVRKHLSLAGYKRFFTVTDSRLALDRIRIELPDVLLLDVMMPHVSGLDILEALRARREFADLPVIVLTASSDRETKLAALRLGATEFLTKPVDSVELEARLRNVLAMKAHQDRVKNYAWELELEVAVRSAELAGAHQEVVECLAKVGEFRDNDTGRHVIRVGRVAQILAQRLGLPSEIVGRIGQAAPLHDIGKVAIPDAILLKPGKLDFAEFERMKEHARIGREICLLCHEASRLAPKRTPDGRRVTPRGMSPILQMAATIAYTHHEKWDGAGYPLGLSGDEIPIEGRVTAVADVFDALISVRPYKAAMPVEKALTILRDERGRHFDPAVIDAFFEAVDEILDVCREHADAAVGEPAPVG